MSIVNLAKMFYWAIWPFVIAFLFIPAIIITIVLMRARKYFFASIPCLIPLLLLGWSIYIIKMPMSLGVENALEVYLYGSLSKDNGIVSPGIYKIKIEGDKKERIKSYFASVSKRPYSVFVYKKYTLEFFIENTKKQYNITIHGNISEPSPASGITTLYIPNKNGDNLLDLLSHEFNSSSNRELVYDFKSTENCASMFMRFTDGIRRYVSQNNGIYPSNQDELLKKGYIKPEVLKCSDYLGNQRDETPFCYLTGLTPKAPKQCIIAFIKKGYFPEGTYILKTESLYTNKFLSNYEFNKEITNILNTDLKNYYSNKAIGIMENLLLKTRKGTRKGTLGAPGQAGSR